jgi:hypothetical protein
MRRVTGNKNRAGNRHCGQRRRATRVKSGHGWLPEVENSDSIPFRN